MRSRATKSKQPRADRGENDEDKDDQEARRPRILLIDDNPEQLALLARGLGGKADVACANGTKEALAELDTTPFDVILSDYNLAPDLGTDLLRHARERWPHTILFLMSGTDVPSFWHAPFVWDAFFQKPFDWNAVFDAIDERSVEFRRR